MEISLNGVRVGEESANVKGTAKGYIVGEIKNKITIQLAFGDGNIGSVTINGTNMTLPEGTQDRVEFEVDPASKYTILVTKSQNTSNVPKTIIWDSDKTNNPNIKDNELLKNGTIEIGGKEIDSGSVVLSVNDVTLSKEQISNFEEKATGYEISSYLDIKLDQILYKGTKDDVWINKLDELKNEATITLQLESGVNGNEVVIVVVLHAKKI